MAATKQSAIQYVQWVQKTYPNLYRAAIRQVGPPPAGGLGDVATTNVSFTDWLSNMGNTLVDLAPQYLQYQMQQDLMEMQLQRAQQGLPPANVADYSPVLRVEAGPETQQAITTGIGQYVAPMLIVGGIAVVGYMLTKKRR